MNEEKPVPTVEEKEEFVSRKAYQDVSQDMHKYKQELQTYKARLSEIEAQQALKEQELLQEQGRWEELYKKSQEKLSSIVNERENEKMQFVNYHKMNSVIQKVGGFKKDDYNKFIDVNNVKITEAGSVDEESLELEVDRIRQNYPELLKSNPSIKLPADAPLAINTRPSKPFNQMTEAEQRASIRQAFRK